ncbi:MAG: peroxidase-related enzyme [Pseudomonadota bacterium]
MSVYPSLPVPAHLEHLFTAFPKGAAALLQLHDDLLRGESGLSVAERELIAAYVSGLNACQFCFGAHRTMAMAFGVDGDTIDALMRDMASAPMRDAMKPVLAYAKKVTERTGVAQEDARAVFEAGWSEADLHDVVMIASLYNFMNRLVDGSGLASKTAFIEPSAEDLKARRDGTYVGWGRAAGFLD